MDTALIVAMVSGVIALISAVVTVWGTLFSTSRTIRFEEKRERARVEREVSRHQEPLATAAYDLQSRIYNIVCKVFVQRFVSSDIERERSYAIDNTTFLIAQYFCCVEILRRSVQNSGYGAHLVNHEAMLKQDMVSAAFGSDRYGAGFMLFAGEQRAVGEALIKCNTAGLECMGYREFLGSLPEGKDGLLDTIRASVRKLALDDQMDIDRLKVIHGLLISLLKQLDPNYVRFPKEYRQVLDC